MGKVEYQSNKYELRVTIIFQDYFNSYFSILMHFLGGRDIYCDQ